MGTAGDRMQPPADGSGRFGQASGRRETSAGRWMSRARGGAMVLGLLAVVWTGPRFAEAFSATYDQHMTMPDGQVVDAKVKVKDHRFRMEMMIQGMRGVAIRNETGTYQYFPDSNMAMQLPGIEATQNPLDDPTDYKAFLERHNGRLVRTETLRGYACEVYEFQDPSAGGTSTAWMWKDHAFPVRLEQHGPQGTAVVELSNIQMGVAVSDAEFRLPAGVSIMGAGGMMDPMKALQQLQTNTE